MRCWIVDMTHKIEDFAGCDERVTSLKLVSKSPLQVEEVDVYGAQLLQRGLHEYVEDFRAVACIEDSMDDNIVHALVVCRELQ